MIERVGLVRAGDRYGPEYVTALTRQLAEVSSAQVMTLSDQADTPGLAPRLFCGFPGWWAKLELFAPWNQSFRPFLYIDLDSFVFATVDHLESSEFRMVRDFYCIHPANSCVMWLPRDTDQIWDEFSADPAVHMAEHKRRGDQGYLAKHCRALWERDAGITSYKLEGKQGPRGCIMQFHGRPKPTEIKEGWVAEHWTNYSSS